MFDRRIPTATALRALPTIFASVYQIVSNVSRTFAEMRTIFPSGALMRGLVPEYQTCKRMVASRRGDNSS